MNRSTISGYKARASLIFGAILSLSAHFAAAAPFPVPPPLVGQVGADVDTGYFNHGVLSLTVESYDYLATILPVGTRFGFFFQGAPETLIPIFDAVDQDPPTQIAIIDFAAGLVIDVDGLIPQAVFTPSNSPIGFFMQTPGDNVVSLYSDPSLNPNGVDVFAAYPWQPLPDSYFLAFLANTLPDGIPALHLSLMTGLQAVPVPPALVLFASGISMLTLRLRRRRGQTGRHATS